MKKYFTIIPITIFAVFLLMPILGYAQELEVKIPGVSITEQDYKSGNGIGNLIAGIYNYAISIVGILAAVVIMFGGFLWLTSGGSSDRVSDAKEWITGALTGLILVLCSFLILKTVNPDLVKMKSIIPKVIEPIGSGEIHADSESEAEIKCDENCGGFDFTLDVIEISKPTKDTPGTYNCECKNSTCVPGSINIEECRIPNSVSTGWCYNGTCWMGDGNVGEPCGNKIGSRCVKQVFNVDVFDVNQDLGGRDCVEDHKCIKY